jgi:ubiquinone/menaquinone biosynthesis C-methylase UbiE
MPYISGGNELIDPQAVLTRLGLKTGDKVADLGCGGAGHFIIPAAEMVGEETIAYAVDILKTVLQSVISKARMEGIYNIKSVWSNLEIFGATKVSAESLDYAILKNILFQSKNRLNIIKEAVRLLRLGGKLLVIDWRQTMSSFGPPPAQRVDPAEVKKIANNLNLKLVDEFLAGNYHYGLIFTK